MGTGEDVEIGSLVIGIGDPSTDWFLVQLAVNSIPAKIKPAVTDLVVIRIFDKSVCFTSIPMARNPSLELAYIISEMKI